MTSRADLRRDHRGEVARLDRVDEHVLAVARPELQPAEGLEELAGEPRHAALVGRLLAGLADDEVDLGARLRDDLLDATRVDPAVAHELRERDSRDLAADRIEAREHHRLRRVVDDQVDAGGLLEGPDVAALAADDPALHLVVREVDDGHRVLRRVVRGDALHRGQDDVARLVGGLLAGPPLDRAGELDRVVLGLLADRLEEHPLGVLGGQAADLLEGRDALLVELLQLLAAPVELDLLLEELAIALLEHVGALVELLVAGVEPALEVRELAATLAGVVLGLALEADLLLLGLEDQVLLLGPGVRDDAGSLLVRDLELLAGKAVPGEEPNADANGKADQRRKGDGDFHLHPPIRSRDRSDALCAFDPARTGPGRIGRAKA